MTLQDQSQTWVDVYSIAQPKDTSAGWSRVFTWQAYVQAAWFPQVSEIMDKDKQQRRIKKVILRTSDPTVFALFAEDLTMVAYQGVPYLCKTTRDVANMGQVFHVDLWEHTGGEPIPGPPVGQGICATLGGTVGL